MSPENTGKGSGNIQEEPRHTDSVDARTADVVTVVLTDDAVELRALLRRLLERSGNIQVVGEAENADHAAELIKVFGPDVLLLDLAMPGGGALELIEALRVAGNDLAIIVLSGYPASSTGGECLSRGADLYLEKGLPVRELTDAIVGVVQKKRGRT
jgi:DNA-binding NarL/FixJ family response regulator